MKQLEVYLPIDKKSVKLGKKKGLFRPLGTRFFTRVFFFTIQLGNSQNGETFSTQFSRATFSCRRR